MKRSVAVLLTVSLLVAGGLSWLASNHPDGLERVAESLGFAENAAESPYRLMPDYEVPGIGGALSTTLAGIIGVAATFGVVYIIGKAITRRKRNE